MLKNRKNGLNFLPGNKIKTNKRYIYKKEREERVTSVEDINSMKNIRQPLEVMKNY